ncbi:hypothetical protein ACFL0U_02760 [Pseudomonadota bacterium]
MEQEKQEKIRELEAGRMRGEGETFQASHNSKKLRELIEKKHQISFGEAEEEEVITPDPETGNQKG